MLDLLNPTDESGVQAAGQGEFTRLKNGEISLDEYLDAAVISATGQLADVLDSDRLLAMREILRSQLKTHPALSQWVASLNALENTNLEQGAEDDVDEPSS